MAKLVDALDLGSSEHPSWEFESLRPQYMNEDTTRVLLSGNHEIVVKFSKNNKISKYPSKYLK